MSDFSYEQDLLRLREITFARLEDLRSDMAAGPLVNAAMAVDEKLAELHPAEKPVREGEPVVDFASKLAERRARSKARRQA